MNSIQAISDFVLARPEDRIPEAVLRHAGLLLLDTLGVCAAATPMAAGVIARNGAAAMYAAGAGADSAPMLFDGRRVSLPGAVFAAATQTDNLDAHDGFNPTKGHVGVVAMPALLALAEGHDLGGRQALAALVVGYEIAGRAAMALHGTVSDYHTSGAWNALGVVAMAARIRGQGRDQLRDGLGIAEFHGPRSQMMREIANPTMLHDGSGWGAMAGMSAALLAEAGFTGAPAITLEAPEVAPFWADLGQHWQTPLHYIKPYPICRWAHAPIDAARGLCADHKITAEQIEAIHIRSFFNAVQLISGMPETTSQAQYSLAFAVAAQSVNGHIGVAQITGDALADARVARLVARTTSEVAPEHEVRYPLERWADVTITLTDGRLLHSGPVHARGGPENPLTQAQIEAKFMAFAAPALGEGRAERIRDACLSLADGAPMSRLLPLVSAPL
mgnify:FL=1|tara:strand:- start:4292 stop:5629 length:1338 start_codon:yes stop_codon:yes gene_type:complete